MPPLVRAAVRYGEAARTDLDLPAGMPYRLGRLWFAYHAMRGYLQAGKMHNTVGWTNANPQHWDFVSWIISERKRNG